MITPSVTAWCNSALARNYSQFEGEVLRQRHPSSVCCRNASPSSVSCTNGCRCEMITAVLAVSLATTTSSVSCTTGFESKEQL
mmetsp:Transcript_33817/g.49634  ORF Transcript_33817/g.49634 Transcript_33817/m.49634 type:complete len:83 (+) Transcript_33817:671-919(+)